MVCLVYSQVQSPLCHRRWGRVTGLEPAAPRFTVWVLSLSVHPQSIWQDSNLRGPVCGTGALPLSY